MEQSIQDAIETVDSARQHKCELEGRKDQLKSAITQVTTTANVARQEVEQYFTSMQEIFTNEIEARQKILLNEIYQIEMEALDPLNDCQTVVNEGIEEATTVINSGENILNNDMETDVGLNQVEKFVTMTNSLALDSVPEVPSTIEVPSVSAIFNVDFVPSVLRAIQLEGRLCRQSPVQITSLESIPGGISASWTDIEEESVSPKEDRKVLYKLQSCYGKFNVFGNKNVKSPKNPNAFKDEYVGPKLSYVVRNLSSNSVYTFRVCRCLFADNNETPKQWSPWSVYQEKMTMMPGFTWSSPNDSASFTVSDKNKVATKKNSHGRVLYSEVSPYLIGYPITFKVDIEGKTRNKCDCIGLCSKRDPEATGIHTKEGTFCVMSDGRVWVNGMCSQTRFSKLTRGTLITFHLSLADEKSLETKKRKIPVYRVVITIGELEAVFDWIPAKSGSFNPQNMAFAIFFQSPGWQVSIV